MDSKASVYSKDSMNFKDSVDSKESVDFKDSVDSKESVDSKVEDPHQTENPQIRFFESTPKPDAIFTSRNFRTQFSFYGILYLCRS